MLISQRLEDLATSYTDSRRSVSEYLLANPSCVERDSMADIAAATFTSKATLVRVAKQLGFSGWSEFSRAYLVEVERRREHGGEVDHSFPFAPGASTREIMESIALVRSQAAWETYQIQDERDVARAAQIMAESSRVFVSGVSVSRMCLELFLRKLVNIGADAYMVPPEEPWRSFSHMCSSDCVVVLSYSGESERRIPMCFLPETRERGCRVIAVTSEGDSFLRRNADITFTMLSHEGLYNKIGTISTEASAACILDMLYGAYFALDYEGHLRCSVDTARRVEGNRLAGAPGDMVPIPDGALR